MASVAELLQRIASQAGERGDEWEQLAAIPFSSKAAPLKMRRAWPPERLSTSEDGSPSIRSRRKSPSAQQPAVREMAEASGVQPMTKDSSRLRGHSSDDNQGTGLTQGRDGNATTIQAAATTEQNSYGGTATPGMSGESVPSHVAGESSAGVQSVSALAESVAVTGVQADTMLSAVEQGTSNDGVMTEGGGAGNKEEEKKKEGVPKALSVSDAAKGHTYICFEGPLGAHLKTEVREKIWKRENIDIFTLLPLERFNIEKWKRGKEHRKEEDEDRRRYRLIPRTFGNWLQAFSIMASVIGEKHPEHCSGLFCYLDSIW
ncbi:hypothetical protein XELAEV_18038909mg [Xenopus laevis]|uniref:Uncharacterized protein n=1 Tax=Xenopus laevis TaxID=8355 RepID=A0A974H7C9_XENLA|nr:hypothetical protein XELAEV_18038909mg [Xenopus laevis]